jgi:hypothetical protein
VLPASEGDCHLEVATIVTKTNKAHQAQLNNQQKDEEGQSPEKRVSPTKDESPKLDNQLVRNTLGG